MILLVPVLMVVSIAAAAGAAAWRHEGQRRSVQYWAAWTATRLQLLALLVATVVAWVRAPGLLAGDPMVPYAVPYVPSGEMIVGFGAAVLALSWLAWWRGSRAVRRLR